MLTKIFRQLSHVGDTTRTWIGVWYAGTLVYSTDYTTYLIRTNFCMHLISPKKRSEYFEGLYFRDLGAKLFSLGINFFPKLKTNTFYFENFIIVLHYSLLKIINS